jgi:hypothetical protein
MQALQKAIVKKKQREVILPPQEPPLISSSEGGTGLYLVGGNNGEIYSSGDITIGPLARGVYNENYSKNTILHGQDDELSHVAGYVSIRGGHIANDGFPGFQGGTVYVLGGRANGGLDGAGTSTWGGDVNVIAPGRGVTRNSGHTVNMTPYSGGLQVGTLTTEGEVNSGDVVIGTGAGTEAGHLSGDMTLSTGGTVDGQVGSVFISTGETASGLSGDIEMSTSALDSASSSGYIILETGENPSGDVGAIVIRGGASSLNNAPGNVSIAGGDLVDYAGGGMGLGGDVLIRGGSVEGTVTSSAIANAVNISGGDVYPDNAGDPTYTWTGGSVTIEGGLAIDLTGASTTRRGNVTLRGHYLFMEVEEPVDFSSSGIQAFAPDTQDRRLPLIGADGILSALGVSVLGVGKFNVTIPAGSHIYHLYMGMRNYTLNASGPVAVLGEDATGTPIYPICAETYTGYGATYPAYLYYEPKVFFSIRTISNGAFVEIASTPIATETFTTISGVYLNLIQFSSQAPNSQVDGLKNLGNFDAEVEINYLVLG